MRKCLKFELIKFINMKILLIFLLFQALWTSIIAWSIFDSINGVIIDNFIVIRALIINGNFHIPIIAVLFIGSMFSIEYENNIELALKLYKNDHMERYIFKTLICIIYIAVSYFIQFFVAYIVQNNIQVKSMDISFVVINTEVIFEQSYAFSNILILYLNQVIGCIFILELFKLNIFLFKNYLKSALFTIALISMINVVEYVMFSFTNISNGLYRYLPLNSEYTWRSLKFLQFGDLTIGLIIFSMLLSIINMIILNYYFRRNLCYENYEL